MADARLRRILSAILREPSGRRTAAYLRAFRDGARAASLAGLLLITPAFAIAQSGGLRGVVSNERGEPIPFASVGIEGTTLAATADAEGRFRIDGIPPGPVTLHASCVGYAPLASLVTVIDGQVVVADQRMSEQVVDLKSFTVLNSITGGSGPSRTLPGSAWYVGPREIQAQAATDVHRLLRSVPGVNIQEEDGFGLRPNIGLRGAGSERSSKITLMEDGVLIAPAPYAAPAAYYFPTVGRMHAVEVVKGSSQVRYGPLTTGGAVNLISTPIPERSTGTLAAWGGSYSTRDLHANAGTTIGRHALLIETFQQASDGFKQLDNGGLTGFNKQDYLAKWQWSSPETARLRQAVALKAGYTSEDGDETYLGLSADDFARTPYRRYAASARDHIDMEHDLLSLRYAVDLGNGPELALTLYRTNTFRNWYKLDQVKDSTGTKVPIDDLLADPAAHAEAFQVVRGATSEEGALLVKANNRNYQATGAQLILTHRIDGDRVDHAIEAGIRLHDDRMDRFQWVDGWRMDNGEMFQTSAGVPGTESNRVAQADALATHLVYDVDFGRLALHPGLRFEHIVMRQEDYGKQDPARTGSSLVASDNTVEVWIPGIGADLALSQAVLALAGVHKGFSPPGTQEGMLPEESINCEAGLRVERPGFDLQLIGFLNDYEQMLGSDLAAAGGTGSGDLFNAGEALVQGIELYASCNALHGRADQLRLPLSISYTFTDARFGSSFTSSFEPWGEVLEGDRIPYTPMHQLNVSAGLASGRASLSISANYQGEVITMTGPASDSEGSTIEPRTVIDANAHWRFNTQCEVFATVTNLADRVYEASHLPAGTRPGMPRAINAGVRLRF